MAKLTKAQQLLVEESKEMLHKFLKPGSRVFCVLRHVSRSGMQRRIDFYAATEDGGMQYLTGWIGHVLGYRVHRDGQGIIVNGCGMDMGLSVVHSLSYALHGYPKAGDQHKQNDPNRPGYTLRHEWL